MFYTVYKVTNKVNGKFYIGKHQTNNLDDDYMGSGKLIKAAIKKYGLESFVKEILAIFESEEQMNEAEKQLVVLGENSYNLCEGGKGGFGYLRNHPLRTEWSKEGRKETNKVCEEKYGLEWRSIIAKRGQQQSLTSFKERLETDPNFRELIRERMKEKGKLAHTKEANAKRRISFAKKNVQQKEKNSQYGKMWICNPTLQISKSIHKEEDIPFGWIKGRICTRYQ